jgi:hypothetical protein
MRGWTVFGLMAVLVLMVGMLPSPALSANWEVAESEDEIEVTTSNKNGSERRTTIWIAVLDTDAFVRTSGTPWERNIKRDPNAVLTIAGKDTPIRFERIRNDELIDRVQRKFREKYGGVPDRMARFVRILLGAGSHIYRVDPPRR